MGAHRATVVPLRPPADAGEVDREPRGVPLPAPPSAPVHRHRRAQLLALGYGLTLGGLVTLAVGASAAAEEPSAVPTTAVSPVVTIAPNEPSRDDLRQLLARVPDTKVQLVADPDHAQGTRKTTASLREISTATGLPRTDSR